MPCTCAISICVLITQALLGTQQPDPPLPAAGTHLATGMKIGEVGPGRAVVWSRRTQVSEDDSAAAATGDLQAAWWPLERADELRASAWVHVEPEGDSSHQFVLEGLEPGTPYAVELRTRAAEDAPVERLRGAFSTAPTAQQSREVSFVVVTGQDYHRRDDDLRGHRVYEAMGALGPDFFVHTGDVVYYDKPRPDARNVADARLHWHRMYSLPLQREFHREVPCYFLKDDHDTLKNDCWPGQSHGDLSFSRGVELFREQTPSGAKPYRRFRWGAHLELWLLEGREFRSPNTDPDGPRKTILGAQQLAWLERTLGESDATFRIIVSATPIVGPDRSSKADNHANRAFAHEGTRLRELIAAHPGAVVVCGDRHWQYTSVDEATGLWEFSCGPTTDRHAGGFSEDRRSSAHRYLAVRGGFLSVAVELTGSEESPVLSIEHHDPLGLVLHQQRFSAPER
jgi:alkaline phosphatase D